MLRSKVTTPLPLSGLRIIILELFLRVRMIRCFFRSLLEGGDIVLSQVSDFSFEVRSGVFVH